MEFGVKFIQDLAIILLVASIGAKGARLLGVSTLVGYLLAGVLVGAADFVFFDITDPERLRILSHLGIVFVMFSLGLGARLSDLRFTGVAPFVAVGASALIMLSIGRVAGGLAGLGRLESLFFTSMLMISSSVSVNKHLVEMGLLHQRAGQMARSQTMLETVLAVMLLSILGPLAAHDQPGAEWSALVLTLGKLAAFAILFVVVGMLLVPRLLRRTNPDPHGELQTVFLTGTLFALSLITVLAGYSLALGAFLTGLITAEIPRTRALERMFTGIRDVFRAVFFIAMGMATDLRLIVEALPLILLGTGVALGGRLLASTVGWTLAGEEERRAAKIAMLVTPTGAFSLIIARLGMESGAIPETLRAAAIGIVFLTGICGSLSMRSAEKMDEVIAPAFLGILSRPMAAYRELWRSIGNSGGMRFLWRFIKPRIWQISREVCCVSAVFIFAHPLSSWLDARIEMSATLPRWRDAALVFYWLLIVITTLPWIVALLRNLDAICMMISDYLKHQSSILRRLHSAHLGLLRLLAYGTVCFWIFNLIPWDLLSWQVVCLLGFLAIGSIRGGWRGLIRIHNQIEMDLNGMVEQDFSYRNGALSTSQLRTARTKWKLHLREVELPDLFFGAGRSLDELDLRRRTGVTVVGIDRQGLALTRLSPQTQIFSGDTLFLLGRREEIRDAVALLSHEDPDTATAKRLHRSMLESVTVLPTCGLSGQSLHELEWPRRLGVQILAVRRDGIETVNPGPQWILLQEDELLLAGTEDSLAAVRRVLDAECAPSRSYEDDIKPAAASVQ